MSCALVSIMVSKIQLQAFYNVSNLFLTFKAFSKYLAKRKYYSSRMKLMAVDRDRNLTVLYGILSRQDAFKTFTEAGDNFKPLVYRFIFLRDNVNM